MKKTVLYMMLAIFLAVQSGCAQNRDATVIETIETVPDETEQIVKKNNATYHIRPVNSYTVKEAQGTTFCRDAKIKRVEGFDEEIVSAKICRDNDRWFVQYL